MTFVKPRKSVPFRFLTLLIFVFWLGGCQSVFQTRSTAGVYHTVQPGQTLYRIAQVYDLDVKTLSRVNDISDPTQIQPGQRLWIPNARRVLPVPSADSDDRPPRIAGKNIPPPKGKPESSRPVKGLIDWPLNGGTLTSRFGNRNGRHHDGIDIAANTGTPILAAAAGKVVFSGDGPRGYGLMVIVKHSNDFMTVYAHNSYNQVGRGMTVRKGQQIARVGSTGRSTGPHLHFEVRRNTHPVNPLQFLPPYEEFTVARRIR